jgi:hypothetical protein
MTTHVLLLLDGSGSMEEVHADALASVNSFMANAKKHAALRDAFNHDVHHRRFCPKQLWDHGSGSKEPEADE